MPVCVRTDRKKKNRTIGYASIKPDEPGTQEKNTHSFLMIRYEHDMDVPPCGPRVCMGMFRVTACRRLRRLRLRVKGLREQVYVLFAVAFGVDVVVR